MNSQTRRSIEWMILSFFANMVCFAEELMGGVVITETHLIITTVLALIFLASAGAFLYYSNRNIPT